MLAQLMGICAATFKWSNSLIAANIDHAVTIEFNSDDSLLNELPNPFRFENFFLLLAAFITMAGAISVVLTAKDLFSAHKEPIAAVALAVAAILMAVCVPSLVQALSQLRFYLGRKYPTGLADELALTQPGVSEGTEKILDAMRHQALEFPEPQGALNGILYSLVKNLVTSPPQVQAAAVRHFHSLVAMATLFGSLVVSYFGFVGTGHEGVASWLYLPMSGLSLLTPFTQPDRWGFNRPEEPQPSAGNNAVWKFAGLIVFAILAPVVVPRSIPAFAVPPMWTAPGLLLIGSMVASAIFFLALLARLDGAGRTSVACEQTTIAMNCPPAQLWAELGRRFQREWTRKIPNRTYASVAPDVSAGDRGLFCGLVLEETQPVPTSALQFPTWTDAIKTRYSRLLIILGTWGVAAAAACSAAAVNFVSRFAEMTRMEISRCVLIVIALSLVAALSLRIGHLLWSRIQFKSRLYWIETSGTYQTAQLSVGNRFRGHAHSSTTLMQIEDATLRVWVTDIVSVVFGKDGQRSIIAMTAADSTAKSLTDHLVKFAAEQSAIAAPTSRRDLSNAQTIGALDVAVQQAARKRIA